MKTSRNDIKRDKRQVKCFNSTLIGYSTYTLNKGDMFLFRYAASEMIYYAISHGRVKGSTCEKYSILAQVLGSNLRFSMERWIKPEDVIEIIPRDKVSKHLLAMFEEQEKEI